jgi:lipid A 3-O-deacylase
MPRWTWCLPLAAGLAASPAAQAAEPLDQQSIWTFQVENDAVSTLQGTSDQYYTSGLRLGGW